MRAIIFAISRHEFGAMAAAYGLTGALLWAAFGATAKALRAAPSVIRRKN
jgi:hypothetical protein